MHTHKTQHFAINEVIALCYFALSLLSIWNFRASRTERSKKVQYSLLRYCACAETYFARKHGSHSVDINLQILNLLVELVLFVTHHS